MEDLTLEMKLVWNSFHVWQVLQGLSYLHNECKIIHTDIKPENILIQVEPGHVSKMAAQASFYHKHGLKLPNSAVSAAPPDMLSASSTRKRKSKKRSKRILESAETETLLLVETGESKTDVIMRQASSGNHPSNSHGKIFLKIIWILKMHPKSFIDKSKS